MKESGISERLSLLHEEEQRLRDEAEEIVRGDERLALHLSVVEHAMDLADLLRQFPTEDEDLKVVQMLGMRTFNAFAASLKLALSGYGQNSTLIMRDILETVFLLDLFDGDRSSIERWRCADKAERLKHFRPVKVRDALDQRDGFDGKRRAEHYKLFSELAGHPNMEAVHMLRPQKDGDAVSGPFIEATFLAAVLSEMGKLAVLAGDKLTRFMPDTWAKADAARAAFSVVKWQWIDVLYRRGSKV